MLMLPIEVHKRIGEARSLVDTGHCDAAVEVINNLVVWFSSSGSDHMNTAEKMEVLGALADLYSHAGDTAREIPMWELLCTIAKHDLDDLGIMASSEDILRTAFDYLRLGRAYRQENRRENALSAFEQSAEILGQVGIAPNIQDLMDSDDRVFVGEYDGRRFYVT